MRKRIFSPTMTAISKRLGTAIRDYQMIHEGDRIMIAVSGGKDSLALVPLLKHHQSCSPVSFELIAVHVDLGLTKISIPEIESFFDKEHIKYHIEHSDVMLKRSIKSINCFWCAWNRKKILFYVADQFGCNKIAFGHHMDDIIETILLNFFYHGEISAMVPKQEFFNGKFTIIRPLAYEKERNLKRLLKTDLIPNIDLNTCPHQETSKRKHMKALIKQLERDNPAIKTNIFRGLQRIRKDRLL